MTKSIPSVNDSVLFLIDVQEKFVPAISNIENCLSRCSIMLKAADLLSLDVIVTEQYPKGLGYTVPELKKIVPYSAPYIEKSSFSCLGESNVVDEVKKKDYKNIILIGIESHVCVQQTALDAQDMGYNVFIPADCVSSRQEAEKAIALSCLAHKGVNIVSCESILFMLMQSAAHPNFRDVSKLIK